MTSRRSFLAARATMDAVTMVEGRAARASYLIGIGASTYKTGLQLLAPRGLLNQLRRTIRRSQPAFSFSQLHPSAHSTAFT